MLVGKGGGSEAQKLLSLLLKQLEQVLEPVGERWTAESGGIDGASSDSDQDESTFKRRRGKKAEPVALAIDLAGQLRDLLLLAGRQGWVLFS